MMLWKSLLSKQENGSKPTKRVGLLGHDPCLNHDPARVAVIGSSKIEPLSVVTAVKESVPKLRHYVP
jgi:hypothetical protein